MPAARAPAGGIMPVVEAAPAALYRSAHERAKNEITVDNAASRLREIERDIDREAAARR